MSLDFAKYLGAGKTVLAEKQRSLAKLCVSRGIYQQPKCFPLTPRQSFQGQNAYTGLSASSQPIHLPQICANEIHYSQCLELFPLLSHINQFLLLFFTQSTG